MSQAQNIDTSDADKALEAALNGAAVKEKIEVSEDAAPVNIKAVPPTRPTMELRKKGNKLVTKQRRTRDPKTAMWHVKDKAAGRPGAENPVRIHELISSQSGEIKPFKFEHWDEAVEVPMDFATRLVGNDGFEVFDHNGNEIEVGTSDADGGGIALRSDQLIVSYDDVTHGKLLEIAEDIGLDVKKNISKPDLILGLVKNYERVHKLCGISSSVSDDDIDDFSDPDSFIEEEEDAY